MQLGLISEERYEAYLVKKQQIEEEIDRLTKNNRLNRMKMFKKLFVKQTVPN